MIIRAFTPALTGGSQQSAISSNEPESGSALASEPSSLETTAPEINGQDLSEPSSLETTASEINGQDLSEPTSSEPSTEPMPNNSLVSSNETPVNPITLEQDVSPNVDLLETVEIEDEKITDFAENHYFPESSLALNQRVTNAESAVSAFSGDAIDSNLRFFDHVNPAELNVHNTGYLVNFWITETKPLGLDTSGVPTENSSVGDKDNLVQTFVEEYLIPNSNVLEIFENEFGNITSNHSVECPYGGYAFYQVDRYTDPNIETTRELMQINLTGCQIDENSGYGGQLLRIKIFDGNLNQLAKGVSYNLTRFGEYDQFDLLGHIVEDYSCDLDTPLRSVKMLIDNEMYLDKQEFLGLEQEYLEACLQGNYLPTIFSGEIYHGGYGKVKVSTPEMFAYTSDPVLLSEVLPEVYEDLLVTKNTGYLSFSNDRASESTAKFEWIGGNLVSDEHPLRGLFTVENENSWLLDYRIINAGYRHSNRDWNGNKLDDYFDRYIDPNDLFIDPDADEDGDGRTNLEEQRLGTNPVIEESTPQYPEQAITLNLVSEYNPLTDSMDATALLGVMHSAGNLLNAKAVREQTIRVSAKSSSFSFSSDLPDSCELENESEIVCINQPETISDEPVILEIPLLVDQTGSIEITASLDDPWLVIQDIEKQNAIIDENFSTDVQGQLSLKWDSVMYVIRDSISTVSSQIDLLDFPITTDISIGFSASHPDAIQDIEFVSSNKPGLEYSCTLFSPIECILKDVSADDTIVVNVSYFAQENIDQSIEVILSAEHPVLEETRAQITLIPSLSSGVLQAEIDSAGNDSTVRLPAGIYFGNINLNGKDIDIEGSTDDQRTTLVSTDVDTPLISNTRLGTTINNLTFQTTGAPILENPGANTTVQNSIIEPVSGLPHRMVSLATTMQSYRLKGNTIRNWGVGEDGHCRSLISDLSYNFIQRAVSFEQNIVYGNDCEMIFDVTFDLSPPGQTAMSRLLVNNNTFVDNPNVFVIQPSGSSGSIIRIYNNIVVGAIDILRFTQGTYSQGNWLQTSNNLVWDSVDNSVLSDDELIIAPIPPVIFGPVTRDEPDVEINPNFVNKANNDFRLSENSLAIDSGIQPFPYSERAIAPAYMFADPEDRLQINALDGNGDGVAEYDFGALEYEYQ